MDKFFGRKLRVSEHFSLSRSLDKGNGMEILNYDQDGFVHFLSTSSLSSVNP